MGFMVKMSFLQTAIKSCTWIITDDPSERNSSEFTWAIPLICTSVFISDTFLFQQYFHTFQLSATNVTAPVGVGYNKVLIWAWL